MVRHVDDSHLIGVLRNVLRFAFVSIRSLYSIRFEARMENFGFEVK